jgi:hypothetical protein
VVNQGEQPVAIIRDGAGVRERSPLVTIVSVQPSEFQRMIRERRKSGGDRYDEIWDRVHVWKLVGSTAVGDGPGKILRGEVLGLSPRPIERPTRPQIEVSRSAP